LSKLFKALLAFALISIFLAGGLLLFDYFKTQERFPPKFFIGSVDVSGLTKQEAIDAINSTPIQALVGTVNFIASNEIFSFSPRDLGVYVLPEETVSSAFDSFHKSNYFLNLKTRFSKRYLEYHPKFSFVEESAQEIIKELAQQIDSPAIDARIDLDEKTGGFHIYPDKPGRKLKQTETLENLKNILLSGENNIKMEIDYISSPKITEAELRANPPVHRLSAYTTYYGSHDSPNRIHNIRLIASWINNTLLMPGDIFSVTEKIGDFTAERGFKEAFVIINNELVPELGGGTCQIGTTLYNAVAIADLKVLSRRNHSFYFNIYPLGRDATIYPGSADFKFKNDTGYPILIKTLATKSKLSFRIYGTPSGKVVDFSSPSIFILDEDGVFKPSTMKNVIAKDRPFRTVITRTVKDSSGKEIKSETIRSYYKMYGEKTNVPIRRPEPR